MSRSAWSDCCSRLNTCRCRSWFSSFDWGHSGVHHAARRGPSLQPRGPCKLSHCTGTLSSNLGGTKSDIPIAKSERNRTLLLRGAAEISAARTRGGPLYALRRGSVSPDGAGSSASVRPPSDGGSLDVRGFRCASRCGAKSVTTRKPLQAVSRSDFRGALQLRLAAFSTLHCVTTVVYGPDLRDSRSGPITCQPRWGWRPEGHPKR
jgi:hypothetical protein